MDITVIVIVTNTLVVLATFVATLYLESLRKYIKAERDSISKLDEKELNEFLDYLERLGE